MEVPVCVWWGPIKSLEVSARLRLNTGLHAERTWGDSNPRPLAHLSPPVTRRRSVSTGGKPWTPLGVGVMGFEIYYKSKEASCNLLDILVTGSGKGLTSINECQFKDDLNFISQTPHGHLPVFHHPSGFYGNNHQNSSHLCLLEIGFGHTMLKTIVYIAHQYTLTKPDQP